MLRSSKLALEIDSVCPSLVSLLREQTSRQPINVVSWAGVARRVATFGDTDVIVGGRPVGKGVES